MRERVTNLIKAPETKRVKEALRARNVNTSQPVNSSTDRILFLQRTVGNQTAQRLVRSGALQAKLRIGAPGDVYEQEADRVAEQVARMPKAVSSSDSRPVEIAWGAPVDERKLPGHELAHTIQRLHLQSDTFALQREVQPGTPASGSPRLTLSYTDFLRMQEERFIPVYRYMEENRTILRSLDEWVAAVRRNVPGTSDISRAELELAVRQGAARYSINIMALPLVPQSDVPERRPSGEGLSNKLRELKDQVEHFVETITTYGNPETIEVTLGFSGVESALERRGFRFSWIVGWRGQLGARVSHRVFNGDLSLSFNSDWIAPQENPTYSATLQFGPTAPNYTRLQEIFNNAGRSLTNYIRGLVQESHGVSDGQISEAETSIEDMISQISDAAEQIKALTPEEEPPTVNFSIQAGYGGPSLVPREAGHPEPPAGFFVQGFLTLHF